MSEYGFGDEEFGFQADESGQNGKQGGNGLRQYLDEISTQLKEMRAENAALKAEKTRSDIEDALKVKGYEPAAAGLYQGDPAKLDEWLTAHGGALAKVAQEGQTQGEVTPQGPPASTVPADGQAEMQRMMEQGTAGVAAPQGSDRELAAAIAAATSNEELEKLMRASGNQFSWE